MSKSARPTAHQFSKPPIETALRFLSPPRQAILEELWEPDPDTNSFGLLPEIEAAVNEVATLCALLSQMTKDSDFERDTQDVSLSVWRRFGRSTTADPAAVAWCERGTDAEDD